MIEGGSGGGSVVSVAGGARGNDIDVGVFTAAQMVDTAAERVIVAESVI
jgi:hypothetical protein